MKMLTSAPNERIINRAGWRAAATPQRCNGVHVYWPMFTSYCVLLYCLQVEGLGLTSATHVQCVEVE